MRRPETSFAKWHEASSTLKDAPEEHRSIADAIRRTERDRDDAKDDLANAIATDGRTSSLATHFDHLVTTERRWQHMHDVVTYLTIIRDNAGKLASLLADRSAGIGVSGELPTALGLVMYETWRNSPHQGSHDSPVQQARLDLRAEVDRDLIRGRLDGLRTFTTDAALALLRLGQAAWQALEAE